MKSSNNKHNTMPRIGCLIVYDGEEDGLTNRVGKVIKKIYQKQENMAIWIEICLIKLNYNGQLWLIPSTQIRCATKEEKKKDKKNPNYWGNEYSIQTPLRFVESAEPL